MTHRLLPLALVLLFPSLSLADIVLSGHRNVPHEVLVQSGDLADRCLTTIRVKEGETLSEIAQQRLGSVSRLEEIRALNPKLDPDKIRPGDLILLPPQKPAGDGESYLLYYRSGPGAFSKPELVVEGVPLRGHYMAQIYAVPLKSRAEFEALFTDRKNMPEADAIPAKLDVAISTSVGMGIQLPKAKAPAKIETRVRLKKIDGKELLIASEDVHLDRNGKVVDSASQAAALLPLVGLGLVGALGALLLGRKRRQERTA